MIYIVHGDNEVSSRKHLTLIKEQHSLETRKELQIGDSSPQDLFEACVSFDIFGSPPLVIFDISKAGRTGLKDYLNSVSKIPSETVLIVYSAKNLSKSNLFVKNASNLDAKVIASVASKKANVFDFVDYVFFGNRKGAYTALKQLMLEREDTFYVFSMLIYGLRNLSYKVLNSPGLSKMHPFVKGKVTKQATAFNETSVINLFHYFYSLDKQVKSGELSSDLLVPLALEKVLQQRAG